MRNLPQKAEQILAVLYEYDGLANTKEIQRSSGISAALITHHSAALQDAELVEKRGMEDIGEPALVTVYELTAEGEHVAMMSDGNSTSGEVTLQANDFCDHITDTDEQADRSEDHPENIEARIDDLEEKIDHAIRLLEATLDDT